ncbi:MAG: hypothetical protein JXA92_04870 [candidate division Zixibacteria bacterium]|nr:hypothetical protein [candidate division Zixibacteria bacterium]
MLRCFRFFIPLVILALVSINLVCGDSSIDSDHYDRYDYLYILSIISSDTLANGDSVMVIYEYPVGCNDLETLNYDQIDDTLYFKVLYHFYYHGFPCAHGPGVSSTYVDVTVANTG